MDDFPATMPYTCRLLCLRHAGLLMPCPIAPTAFGSDRHDGPVAQSLIISVMMTRA